MEEMDAQSYINQHLTKEAFTAAQKEGYKFYSGRDGKEHTLERAVQLHLWGHQVVLKKE